MDVVFLACDVSLAFNMGIVVGIRMIGLAFVDDLVIIVMRAIDVSRRDAN